MHLKKRLPDVEMKAGRTVCESAAWRAEVRVVAPADDSRSSLCPASDSPSESITFNLCCFRWSAALKTEDWRREIKNWTISSVRSSPPSSSLLSIPSSIPPLSPSFYIVPSGPICLNYTPSLRHTHTHTDPQWNKKVEFPAQITYLLLMWISGFAQSCEKQERWR